MEHLLHFAGVEGARFHDLRRSFASLMLLRGVKPEVISKALSHSSVAFTMDVYSHIIGEMQESAMTLSCRPEYPQGFVGKSA